MGKSLATDGKQENRESRAPTFEEWRREMWANARTSTRERAGGGKPWEKMSLNYRSVCENFSCDFRRNETGDFQGKFDRMKMDETYLQIVPIPVRPVFPGYRPGGSRNPQ